VGRARSGNNDAARVNRGEVMKELIVRLIRDEQGQDLVEYALIVAAVGLALITTVNQLSQGVVSLYQSITGDLSSIGATAQ
jgi:Flp pilus assembly pilin Flp